MPIVHPIQLNIWVVGVAIGVTVTSDGSLFGAALGLSIASTITLIINLMPSR